MTKPPPAILTWRSLHLADAVVCDELNARLAEGAGCSLIEHDLLAWLGAAPGKRLRMLDLATRLRVTAGGLTRIIDRLVDRGWIERDRPAENRREVYATLTRAGAAALRTARVIYSRVIEEAFARHFDEQDLVTLDSLAQKLLDRLGPEASPLRHHAAEEQHDDGADHRADEAGGSQLEVVPSDQRPEEATHERADHPEHGGAEAAHRIAARDQEARDRAGQEPDDQEPDQDEHATHPSPATSAEQRYPDRATVKRGQDAG
jgi:DNA-binding MarR family transcriptional regulator